MENPSIKLKEIYEKVKLKFQENFSKNIINIGFMLYYIFYAIISLSTLLISNEIALNVYWKVLVLCLNLPVLVVSSLILVGKWKGSQTRSDMLEKFYDVQLQLELKKQEIEFMKLLQQQAAIIGDLTEQISRLKDDFRKEQEYEREISEYRTLLAARDGKVPEAICRVKDWNEANKTIEIIEKSEEPVKPPTE